VPSKEQCSELKADGSQFWSSWRAELVPLLLRGKFGRANWYKNDSVLYNEIQADALGDICDK
jgi:hypothetical protein